MRTKIYILILVYNFCHGVSLFCIFILGVSFSFIRRLFYIVQTCCIIFNKAGRRCPFNVILLFILGSKDDQWSDPIEACDDDFDIGMYLYIACFNIRTSKGARVIWAVSKCYA